MIWPLSWFPWIIWYCWPFVFLFYINPLAAIGAELTWLAFIKLMKDRKRARRARSHRVDAQP